MESQTGNQTGVSLTRQSPKPLVASLREQSASTIQAAIRSRADEGEILARTNAVLALYYDPDLEPETRVAIREEFVRALSSYPAWAIHKAFDAWTRSAQRRPTPGDIVILVGREMKPLTDELARRDREEADRREERPELTAEEIERRRKYAASVLSDAGFASRMATTGPRRETVTDEDLAEMRAMLSR